MRKEIAFFVFSGPEDGEGRRTINDAVMAGCREVGIRIPGDGKGYKLSVHTARAFDGVMYQAAFATRAGEWTEVEFPFSEFAPTCHGRALSNGPPGLRGLDRPQESLTGAS